MNTKVLAVMASCAISIISMPALAQSQAAAGTPAGGQGQVMQGAQQEQKIFEERKADILARLRKVENCIQAANDQGALIACLPRPPEAQGQGGPGMMQGGMGGSGQ